MIKTFVKMLITTDLTKTVSTCGVFIATYWKMSPVRGFHLSGVSLEKKEKEKNVMVFTEFSKTTSRSKNTFLEMVKLYEGRHKQRRGHVEFIYAALKHMDEYGVSKDREVYKALIDVMPKGTMVPTNVFQVEFMHYPKQQYCIIDLLEKMEDNGVMPDAEMEQMLLNIFGKKGHPLRKYWRMMYWMPKFKNLSPWKVPNPAPDDLLLLAQIAIERITSVDLRTQIDVYQCDDVEDSVDKTWIVSGMSPIQVNLLGKHPADQPIIVEAGGKVWLRSRHVNYFVLKSEPPRDERPKAEDIDDVTNLRIKFFNKAGNVTSALGKAKSVHEQDDGIIYGVCATGTSSKDSALSWIRILQKEKAPILETATVLFRFKTPNGDLVPFQDTITTTQDKT